MSFAELVEEADRAVQEHLGSTTVLYTPAVGVAVEVQGMFDLQYILVDQGEAGVGVRAPAVFLRLEDLPVDPEVDDPLLTIDGIVYQVRERQPDGLGGVRLVLYVVA